MSKLETNTIDTVSGTSTLQVGSTNTSTITLGVSGDTINVPSGVTIANSGTATGFGGANTPSFLVKLTSDQTISDSVYTKIQFNSEDYDSDNVFDNSSNYKFTVPSGKAGKYFLYTNVRVSASAASRNDETRVSFYKNGTIHVNNQWTFSSNPIHITNNFFSATIDLAVGDYIEVYTMIGEASAGNGTIKSASFLQTYFGGYKIIE